MDLSPPVVWFLIGFALLIAEFALPGIIIVFFGMGAWITALTTWLGLTTSLPSQNIVFCISSVLLLFVLRNRLKNIFVGNATNDKIEDEYTGKEVVNWAKELEFLGAGEIMITSVDNEGTGIGYDIELLLTLFYYIDSLLVYYSIIAKI
jgi:membrane protein implicated in regulation of membrane protease activity